MKHQMNQVIHDLHLLEKQLEYQNLIPHLKHVMFHQAMIEWQLPFHLNEIVLLLNWQDLHQFFRPNPLMMNHDLNELLCHHLLVIAHHQVVVLP